MANDMNTRTTHDRPSFKSYLFVIALSTSAAVTADVLLFAAFSDDDADDDIEYSELAAM